MLFAAFEADPRVDPKFEDRRDSLVAAARSTCFVAVKCHQKSGNAAQSYRSGTAFFVSPTVLLTTGHIVHDHKDTIVIELPGTLEATYFLERLFQTFPDANSQTVMCKLLETGYPDVDVSVLEVVGPYKSEHYLCIEHHKFVADIDAVDVIGYPGDYSSREVMRMHPLQDLVTGRMVHDVEALFPKCELVITHGSMIFGGIQPCYRLSTVMGMSGAPVVLNGNVVGTYFYIKTLRILGVHTGSQSYTRSNRCISFEWEAIWKVLQTCGVVGKFLISGSLFANSLPIIVMSMRPAKGLPSNLLGGKGQTG